MLCISIFITITSHHRPSDCLFNSMPASRNYQNSLLLVLCMQNSPAIGGFPHKIQVIQKTCPYHCVVEENFFYFSVAYYESCNKDFIHATEMFVICLITLRVLKPEYYSEIESISWLLVLLTFTIHPQLCYSLSKIVVCLPWRRLSIISANWF